MTGHRVTLDGGPAAGEQVLATDQWVWVTKQQGLLHVFDLDRPADQQSTSLAGRCGWDEYHEDPHNPTVYRWVRRTP